MFIQISPMVLMFFGQARKEAVNVCIYLYMEKVTQVVRSGNKLKTQEIKKKHLGGCKPNNLAESFGKTEEKKNGLRTSRDVFFASG